MVMTAITVAAAFTNLGSLNFPVALAIAIFKATLVVLFFMHVKYSSKLTKLVVGGAFFFLIVLFGLTLSDYLSRGWFASPRGSAGAGTQVTVGPPPAPAEAAPAAEPAER
jgi:cytochrome c oxidase subunit 4